jgi:hypothetical protein
VKKLEWIPFDEFKDKIPDSTQPSVTKYLRKNHEVVVKKLHQQYVTGDEWLLAETKTDISYRGTNEIDYILFWAWENKVYLDSHLKGVLYDYLMESYSAKSKIIKRWVRHQHNLITDEEWEIMQSINTSSRALIKGVVFLTLFLMKPLRELSDEDLDIFPLVYTIDVGSQFTKKMVNDYRMQLGYTNKIVRRVSGNSWENKLFKHHMWGDMFKEYHDYLIRGQAKKKLISQIGIDLCTLMKYLDKHHWTSCSHFTWKEYKEFTEFLLEKRKVSSVSTMIGKYKKFFLWGSTSNDFFPKEINFPDSYWKSLNIAAKKHAATSDGLAFESETIAEGIVQVLKTFKPSNEIEQLCLNFWLIIVSCPARFGFILNLQAEDTLQPFPNKTNALGIFSMNADKAGNKNAQFPFVDKMGIRALETLQARSRILKFRPLYNERHKRSYVHLFQLPEPPWILNRDMLWTFFTNQIKPKVASNLGLKQSTFKGGAHGFRHYILTEIFKRTGSMEAVRVGAGHTEQTMSKTYLKSNHAKKALVHRAIDKYEKVK